MAEKQKAATVKIFMLKRRKNFAYDENKEYEVPAEQAELLVNEAYAKYSEKVKAAAEAPEA